MAKPCPGLRISGKSTCLTTWLCAPSAPNKYFVRILYSVFDILSRSVAVMRFVFESVTKEISLVSKRTLKPWRVAYLIKIGSRRVWGISAGSHGLASS